MIAVDTSVVVAAFAPWHERHDDARRAMGRRPFLPVHCGLETYATLTRMPDPFRASAPVVADYIDRRFRDRRLSPDADDVRALPSVLAGLGIVGGATYDALVAVTARGHSATLKTIDQRAEVVYRLLGCDYELLPSG